MSSCYLFLVSIFLVTLSFPFLIRVEICIPVQPVFPFGQISNSRAADSIDRTSNAHIQPAQTNTFANLPTNTELSTSEASRKVGNIADGNSMIFTNIPRGQSCLLRPTDPSNGPSPSATAVPSSQAHTEAPSRPPHTQQKPRSRSGSRNRKQLLPSQELWERIGSAAWACRYIGPAAPFGCNAVLSSSRNLGRHMREIHAHEELMMDLPQDQRVAYNGLPDGLRSLRVTCPYKDQDLNLCRFYRENNRRWETNGLGRKDKVIQDHILEYHHSDEFSVRAPERRGRPRKSVPY